MKLITILPAIIALLFTTPVFAKCENNSKTVFSCMTAKGKHIEVCDAKKTITYSFGKPQEKPEIVVKIPRQQASTSQWSGFGRYLSYAVDIPNGTTTYSVFWSVDRISETHAIEAGVNVMVNKELASTVLCAGKNIEQYLEGITLKATE